jgi:hypothetical protein
MHEAWGRKKGIRAIYKQLMRLQKARSRKQQNKAVKHVFLQLKKKIDSFE